MVVTNDRRACRARRKIRIRKQVNGTTARPRLCVFRSLQHLYAQIVDDSAGRTLIAASTREKTLAARKKGLTVATAKQLGAIIAERALAQSIRRVVFDRGGYLYHGRVKAVADGAREKGLEF